MRKILIITPRFYPDPVVGAVRMTQWARWLPKHGWIPIVACGNYGFSIDREEIPDLIHPDALAAAILSTLAAPVDRSVLKERAKVFSVETATRKYLELIAGMREHKTSV